MTFRIEYTMFKDDMKDYILLDGISMLFQTSMEREKRHYGTEDRQFDVNAFAYMCMDAQKRIADLNKMIELVNREDVKGELDEVQPEYPGQIAKEMISSFEQQIDKLNKFYEQCRELGIKITEMENVLNMGFDDGMSTYNVEVKPS